MQISNYAPVAVFAYNRPDHLKRTLEALAINSFAPETEVTVFSDGAKSESESQLIIQVRQVAMTQKGFKSVTLVEREKNFGLAKSIIQGVTEILKSHDKVIILEDDLVTSPHFLTYMNFSLEKYKNKEDVISVHGYVYPIQTPPEEAFFIKGADCWGWGTWRRGWELFNPNGEELLKKLEDKKLISRFNFDGSSPYEKMLKGFISGKNNSWAVRWYASALLNDKLTLYPNKTLVENIGHDDSGNHCKFDDSFFKAFATDVPKLPDVITESKDGYNQFKMFFKMRNSFSNRIRLVLMRLKK